MTTYIAFLRGINVGTHNRLKMAELRELCESLGLENAKTYIASGNVVFETPATDARILGENIADAIHESFGYEITVMIRTRTELAAVIEQQPFEETTDENTQWYVTFLYEEPEDEQLRPLLAAENEVEKFAVRGCEVYSEVRKDRLENGRFINVGEKLGISATRRTWNVVTKVYELTD